MIPPTLDHRQSAAFFRPSWQSLVANSCCRAVFGDPALRHLPVIMISALDEIRSVVLAGPSQRVATMTVDLAVLGAGRVAAGVAS